MIDLSVLGRSTIVVVGSLNADLVIRVDRFSSPGETLLGTAWARFPGGKGGNQAYAAARLQADVAMVGCAGTDPHGEWLQGHLRDIGVDVALVRPLIDHPTGLAVITVDAAGQNHIGVVPGANQGLSVNHLEPKTLKAARCVLLQLEVPMAVVMAAARMAHEAGATVILDPAPAQPLPPDLLHWVDWLTPNESELQSLCGELRRDRRRTPRWYPWRVTSGLAAPS